MRQKKLSSKKTKLLGLIAIGCSIYLLNLSKAEPVEAARVTGSHLGTFNGSTTFTTSSSNGINPGLFLEVMDDKGNLTQYESEKGVITIPETKEGAYITQAKLLGKTKYMDQDTGEILDEWETGRNLKLESSKGGDLITTTYMNMINDDTKIVGEVGVGKPLSIDKIGETIHAYSDGNAVGWANIQFPIFSQEHIGKKFRVIAEITSNIDHNGGEVFAYLNGSITGEITASPQAGQKIYIDETFTLNRLNLHDVFCIYVARSAYTPVDITIEKLIVSEYVDEYKTNLLTPDEDVVLRGVGDVRDTLDLMTGEVTKRIDETVLDGEKIKVFGLVNGGHFTVKFSEITMINHVNANIMSDKFPSYSNDEGKKLSDVFAIYNRDFDGFFAVVLPKTIATTIEEANQYFKENPLIIHYPAINLNIRTIDLTSDYYFQAVTNQNIQLNGEIEPLVVSITVPTDSLSFTLDPNQEAGQQFIAPDFTLINETLAPLQMELKTFEQTTHVLKDVLPDAHENWEGLNKKESKDIALALVPTPSDGWLSLDEEPRYVANTSNDLIGTVKGQATVEFTFDALYGRAFAEVLNPQYRLVFIFEVQR